METNTDHLFQEDFFSMDKKINRDFLKKPYLEDTAFEYIDQNVSIIDYHESLDGSKNITVECILI